MAFKKEHAQKLGKCFYSMPLATQKYMLPKVTACLFGETSYEIEIMKQAQFYAATNSHK